MSNPNEIDVPFEPTDPMPMADQAKALLCGGLIVRAACVEVEAGKHPAVIFQFVTAEGAFCQPILFVNDDEHLAKMRPVIQEAIAAARRAAKGVTM